MRKLLTTIALFLPLITSAQGAPPIELENPIRAENLPELLSNILQAGMGIVGALALLVFIYGGFRWLTSGGEPVKIQEGKDAMKWATVGLVVIFTSYALVRFVFSTLTG